jgi:hypothetical protein
MVSDNGIETPEGQLDSNKPRPGLGTIIVAGLAKKLDARVEVMRGRRGPTVSITHGTSDRAWLRQAGVGIGSPSKSNGNRVSKRRWCMRASEEISPLGVEVLLPATDIAL